MKQVKNISSAVVISIVVIFAFFGFLILAKPAKASEGTFEIRSTTREDYRCFAASLMMQDAAYRIIMSCRNLIYPAGDQIVSYVAWASPVAGGDPIKLGILGFGKVEYKIKPPINSIFVTIESNAGTKLPSQNLVMRGTVSPITFLDRPTTPTPTPEGQQASEEEVQTPTTAKTSTRERIILGLKRAGVASVLALFAVVGLVFILTRPKS